MPENERTSICNIGDTDTLWNKSEIAPDSVSYLLSFLLSDTMSEPCDHKRIFPSNRYEGKFFCRGCRKHFESKTEVKEPKHIVVESDVDLYGDPSSWA